MRLMRFTSLFAALLLASVAAFAAAPIRIAVDATDAPRDVIHSRLTIPVAPGPLTLWYPKWIPGEHGPTGPIVQVAGFRISANGQTIPWSRDLTEMYEMHVDVPAGVSSIDVDFDFLDPVGTGAQGNLSFTAMFTRTPVLCASHQTLTSANRPVVFSRSRTMSSVSTSSVSPIAMPATERTVDSSVR